MLMQDPLYELEEYRSGVVLGGFDKAGMVQYMKLCRISSKYATVPAMREGRVIQKRTWHLEAPMSHRQRQASRKRQAVAVVNPLTDVNLV